MPVFVNVNIYVFKLCAAISGEFLKSSEMAAHNLNTFIFTFTKTGMLSQQFSEMRPAFFKSFFQWGHFCFRSH